MTDQPAKPAAAPRPDRPRPAFSLVLADGRLVESIYRPDQRRTRFCIWRNGEWREEESVEIDGERFVPYSPFNNLLQHGVVLLPSGPAEYQSEEALLAEVQVFIHRYVDVSPIYEKLAAYYALLTWIFDGFNELPYLRVRGDPGSGKTRFLQVVGSICYKPIFASGASTVSPIFRILDVAQGTLVLDESDFRFTDERAEVVKILNNGNARGFPVLRSELVGRREYDPRAYTVFGPKIVASRGFFEDRALESRFLTEDMGRARMRSDIPVTLPEAAEQQALDLRNKLLLFRFRNFGRRMVNDRHFDPAVEPRLVQVFGPLLSVIHDEDVEEGMVELMRQFNRQHIQDRGMDSEAQVLEVIRDLLDSGDPLSVKEITQVFTDRFGEDYERRVTRKWIGWLLRRKLLLKLHKSHGVFVIPPSELPALKRLFERYGIGVRADPEPEERDGAAEELPPAHS